MSLINTASHSEVFSEVGKQMKEREDQHETQETVKVLRGILELHMYNISNVCVSVK